MKKEEKFIIPDISKVKQVPSDTEIPVYDTYENTKRALCSEFPENKQIINKLEAAFPKNNEQCSSDIFDNKYKVIKTLQELKAALSELLIRFDTLPKNYTKDDYLYLTSILYKSLLYIYSTDPENILTKEWLNPHSDDKIPTEKLVKTTIDAEINTVSNNIQGLVLDIQRLVTALNDEATTRENADSLLQQSKQNVLTPGDNIQINNNVISATDTIYDDTSIQQALSQAIDAINSIITNTSNFRGKFLNTNAIPSNINSYEEDYTGSKVPTQNDYIIVSEVLNQEQSITESWVFTYSGTWEVNGKNGWTPKYSIGHVFSTDQQNAINSTITAQKVNTYDAYAGSITSLSNNKLSKTDSSLRVYGTDSSGDQILYQPGSGISFNNGEIVNTRTTIPWGSITGSIQNQQDLQDELSDLEFKVVDKTSDVGTSFSIDPNKMYMFGEKLDLTITLNQGTQGIVNEYTFQFTSGSTPTTLQFTDSTIKWIGASNVQAGKKYMVSIENGLGIIGEWDNE